MNNTTARQAAAAHHVAEAARYAATTTPAVVEIAANHYEARTTAARWTVWMDATTPGADKWVLSYNARRRAVRGTKEAAMAAITDGTVDWAEVVA